MASVPQPPVVEEVPRPGGDRACVRCGYGVAAGRAPDRCPMCGGTVWRPRQTHEPDRWALAVGTILEDAFLP